VKKTETSPAAIVINAQEAGIVRWIFEAYASGMALGAITRTLEERKVPTKKGKTLWRAQGVRYLLANRTYVGTRYYNTMTLSEDISGKGSGKCKSYTYRDRSEWIGVSVPAIISQELFDCVQARMQESKEKYRHPVTHYLLSGLVECGVCGAGYSSYRRYVQKPLTIGKRRVYHKSAYKCNARTAEGYHARANVERCRNKEVATHLLEDAVFDIVQKQMFDPSKLRACMDALKSDEQKDHAKIGDALMRLARDIQAAAERKKKLIDLYASGNMTEELYVNANIALDKELYALKQKKEEFTRGLPPLHKESIDVSVRQFCETARARFEHCTTFDDKRHFLADFVERVIYDRYRVTVIGAVPIKTQTNDLREIETRKIAFSLSGEIDTANLHKRPRKKFAEDGRLKAYGSGGRKQPVGTRQSPCIRPALSQLA
jgi:site-specific DNA recombinase